MNTACVKENKEEIYEFLISEECKGKMILLGEYPELKIKYLSSENSLCPPHAMCFWEGEVVLKLNINNNIISLNNHDESNKKYFPLLINQNIYLFQGLQSEYQTPMYLKVLIKRTTPQIIKKNKQFTISLPSNPSTGYTWSLETLDNLTLINKQYDKNCTYPGCSGNDIYTLNPIKKGSALFVATYKRPWEVSHVKKEVQTFLVI
jgi:predicted secreted protein